MTIVIMEQKRIKVRLTENSPYSDYGYYEKGDIGYIDGYVNDNAVIILENGKFAKADLRWIEVVNEEDKNVNTELAESEDERIRKELIEFVKSRGGFKQEYIAWLEAQGEQKPNPYSGTSFEYNGHTWGMCARDNGVEILIDGHIKGRVFTNDSNTKEMFIKALERVEEQNAKGYKLTDCDKNSWWEDFKAYTYCTIEQKPNDKIEPKFKVGQTIIYKGTENIAPTKMTISDIAKGQYWDDNCCIVPISDQDNWELVEQKPWSEEDEKQLQHAMLALQWYAGGTDIINWIKSIKDRVQPQSQWKPTKRQLLELSCAISGYSFDKPVLVELEENLKKLMEE